MIIKRILLYVCCFFFAVFLSTTALAATVFSPEELFIENGRKHSSSHGFSADPLAPTKLTITKIEGSGEFRRGRIRLNGKKYKLKEFLRSDELVYEQDIQLLSENKLKVVFVGEIDAALKITINQALSPSATLTSSPEIIVMGESSELIWTSQEADECSIEPDIGVVDCNDSTLVSPPAGSNEYIFTARNSILNEEVTAQTTIGVRIVLPSATLTATPPTIKFGESATLSWTSVDADVCSISSGIGEVDCNGSMDVYPQGTTNYIFTARNISSGTMAAAIAEIGVSIPVPSANLSASPAEIILGEHSTLSWTTTEADDCSLTPYIGSVDCNSSISVAPEMTTHYIFTAKNTLANTAALSTASIEVTYPHPVATISANPNSLTSGESSVIDWYSFGTDSCSFAPANTPVPCEGTEIVVPDVSTVYTMIAENTSTGKSFEAVTLINVDDFSPAAVVKANPSVVELGQSTILSWSTANADICKIEPNIGTVECNDWMEIDAPKGQYTLTAINSESGEQAVFNIFIGFTITFPTASFNASPQTISAGDSSTLTWSTTNADECTLSSIGSVDCNGSITVSPELPIGYVFTAKNSVSGQQVVSSLFVSVTNAFLFINPSEIIAGEVVKIGWTSTAADDCVLEPIGPVDCNGSLEVTPDVTTEYKLTVRNTETGTSDIEVGTIIVNSVPPIPNEPPTLSH